MYPLSSLPLNFKTLNNSIQGFYDYQLRTITKNQRFILLCIVFIVLTISVLTNIATIVVIFKRKIRPFFRACLLSLSFSDLLTSTFQSSTYLTQFSTEFIQIWHLGEIFCRLIPFITTTAILVNSLTLLSIAIDRYMAIKNYIHGTWEPKRILCTTLIILIWGLSAGIASPMISSYFIHDLCIGFTKPENHTFVIQIVSVQMCASDKNNNAYYYVLVFSIVFAPITIVFIWLNTVIAGDIWNRRKPKNDQQQQQQQHNNNHKNDTTSCKCTIKDSCNCSTISQQISTIPPTINNNNNNNIDDDKTKINKLNHQNSKISQSTSSSLVTTSTKIINNNNKGITTTPVGGGTIIKNCGKTRRESRHLRMFCVVLILMALFLFLRLPTWIYLIMRLYGTYNKPNHWILHYSFGILSLFNCMLNPLFYTFLTETIQCSINLTIKMKNCFDFKRYYNTKAIINNNNNNNENLQKICSCKNNCYCHQNVVSNEIYKKISK